MLRRFPITSQKEKTRVTIKIQNRFVGLETTYALNLSRREREVEIFNTQLTRIKQKIYSKTQLKKFDFKFGVLLLLFLTR